MIDVRSVMYLHVAEADEIAKAKVLTLGGEYGNRRLTATLPLEADDTLSGMVISARLLGLNERSSYIWMSWAATYAHHVEDANTREVLMNHVRRTRVLSMKLDPNKTGKIWVKEALAFAREQGWGLPIGLPGAAEHATSSMLSLSDGTTADAAANPREDRLEAIRSMHDKLKGEACKNYTQKTAEHFGISEVRVRQLLKKSAPPSKKSTGGAHNPFGTGKK